MKTSINLFSTYFLHFQPTNSKYARSLKSKHTANFDGGHDTLMELEMALALCH